MEPIVHIILPVCLVLVFFPRVDRRLVIKLSPLTLAPDLDVFLGHRLAFHSIFFIIALLAVIYLISSKDRNATLITLFFLSSHIALDYSGVALFYPFSDTVYGIKCGLYMNLSNMESWINCGTRTVNAQVMTDAPEVAVVSTFGLALLVLTLPPLLFSRHFRKR